MSDIFNIATFPVRAIWYGVSFAASSLWYIANKIQSCVTGVFFPKPASQPGDGGTSKELGKRDIRVVTTDDEVTNATHKDQAPDPAYVAPFVEAPEDTNPNERRLSTSSKESDSSIEDQPGFYSDALTVLPVPWSFNGFHTSNDLKGDFTSNLIALVGQERAESVKEALFSKVQDITSAEGLFEQQALQYNKLLGSKTIEWDGGRDDFYEINFDQAYITISRSFSSPVQPHTIKGNWMLPIDETKSPTPSFSVGHIHDWRFRKFLITFNQLWNATTGNIELDNYKKGLTKGSSDAAGTLGGQLHEIVRLIHAGLEAKDEQTIFAIWKSLEVALRNGAVLAKDADRSTVQFRLFDAFILALYENPQLEFFQFLHASLLKKQGQQPNCGIEAVFKAYEENKGHLGTDAKTVNDEKSRNDIAGYCNLLGIGRFPYPLTSFQILGKKISLYSMGTPTVEERPIVERNVFGWHLYNRPSLAVDCSVNPIPQHWVASKNRANIPYFYNNLQPIGTNTSTFAQKVEKFAADNLGTKYEPRRAAVLKEWLGKAFAAHPADGSWYNGGKEGFQSADIVKQEALENLTNLDEDNAIVAYPAEWSTEYKESVKEILELVHEVFFPSLDPFTRKDRQLFNELTKAFLVLELLIRHDTDLTANVSREQINATDEWTEIIMSIVCRDGMDRAGMLIALVSMMIKILQGDISLENSQKTAQTLYEIIERLCSTTFLTAEQAIEDGSGRRTRLVGCWKKLGLSLDSWTIKDQTVFKRLAQHETFTKFKQRLKIS